MDELTGFISIEHTRKTLMLHDPDVSYLHVTNDITEYLTQPLEVFV